MKKTLSSLAAMLTLAVAAIASTSGPAFAYNVSVVGAGTIMLMPSADSLTLDTTSAVTGLGIFDFQAGTYFVGDSGNLNGPNAYTVVEDVTIDGQTVAVTLPYTNFVSNPSHGNLDNIQIMPVGPIHFALAGVDLTILNYTSPGHDVGGFNTFMIQGVLTAVPEPMSMALLGTGLAGLALRRRPR